MHVLFSLTVGMIVYHNLYNKMLIGKKLAEFKGLVRDSNPGPLAPEERIILLDQQAPG